MLLIYCPDSKSRGTCDVTKCLYVCPKNTRVRCTEYTRKFELIQAVQLDQKYIDKYGQPVLLIPILLRKRRARKPKEK